MSLGNKNKPTLTAQQLQHKFYDKVLTKDLQYYDKAHLVHIMQGIASKRKSDPCFQMPSVTLHEIQANLDKIRMAGITDGKQGMKGAVLELCIRSVELLLYTEFLD